MINRGEMKREAKDAIKNSKISIYVVALALMVINYVINILSLRLAFPGISAMAVLSGEIDLDRIYQSTSFMASFFDVALSLMLTMLTVGFSLCCLRVSRRLPISVGSMFDVFAIFFRMLWLQIVMSIKIWLWSLLLGIPGIIAAYRYRMAPYIMLDDPKLSASECIELSKEMTYGHKWELFVLDLSFIGWAMLCAIPFVSIYVEPYVEVTNCVYYNALSGRSGGESRSYDPEGPRDIRSDKSLWD